MASPLKPRAGGWCSTVGGEGQETWPYGGSTFPLQGPSHIPTFLCGVAENNGIATVEIQQHQFEHLMESPLFNSVQ